MNLLDSVQAFKTQLPSELAAAGFRLFQDRYHWDKNVRAVCIRATDLTSQGDAEQLSMFVDNERRERRERLEDAVEEVRQRYGKKSLTYAVLMGNLKMPNDGRDIVRMPSPMYQ